MRAAQIDGDYATDRAAAPDGLEADPNRVGPGVINIEKILGGLRPEHDEGFELADAIGWEIKVEAQGARAVSSELLARVDGRVERPGQQAEGLGVAVGELIVEGRDLKKADGDAPGQ